MCLRTNTGILFNSSRLPERDAEMKRISHDLPGITQRLAKLGENLSASAAETQQVWRDDKGRAFLQQHIADVEPNVKQLVSSLTQTIERFESIAKQVQDPDQI